MTNQAMLSLVGDEAEALTGAGARLRLLLAAKLVMTTGELSVTLRELSSTNAIVTGERLPSVGTDALLRRGRLEALGTVIWADGTRACLEFEDRLGEADLLAQMNPAGTPPKLPLPQSFN
jgi:hypothetical protein